jgi:hypothetical protein
MRFFPSKLVVHPGDTVNFMFSKTNGAPHTVTFLNGHADIPLTVPGTLFLNPDGLNPSNPGVPFNATDLFSSGLLAPGSPFTSFSLKIGRFFIFFVLTFHPNLAILIRNGFHVRRRT